MATSTSQKLKIKEGTILFTLNAPAELKKQLDGLPPGVKITSSGTKYDQLHWFVLNKAQLEKEIKKVRALLKEEVILWIYYPKGSSKLQTDLNRDTGWDQLMKMGDKLSWLSLISFDDTWSAFGCRLKNEADKKKEAEPKQEREIFKWVNPATKEVRLPDDLAAAFKKNKKIADYFHSLAYSHKKEYVEFIVEAKKKETRLKRIEKTIEMLGNKKKNPADK
jgi:hypothetical protein